MPADITSSALIAELYASGILDADAVERIAQRLEAAGEGEAADDVRSIPISELFLEVSKERPDLTIIDGGNS